MNKKGMKMKEPCSNCWNKDHCEYVCNVRINYLNQIKEKKTMTQFYYLRKMVNGHNKPYATIAIEKNEDGTVNRGIAFCNDADEFVKAKGREISIGRMSKSKEVGHPLFDSQFAIKAAKENLSFVHYGCFHDDSTDFEKQFLN